MKNDFTGFVLIGGQSSRMGADKYALPFRGKTLTENAFDALKDICETRVFIVLNQTQTIETDFAFVRDFYAGRGALGGIHTAVKNCKTEFAVVMAVDLPFAGADVIAELTRIAALSKDTAAVVPRQNDGRIQPLCAVYRAAKCLPLIENLLNETDKASVRDFLALVETKYIAQKDLQNGTETDIFLNLNKPSDYEKACQQS